ncbi:MAG: hypothetical protein DVB23_000012 [Verrucomicrobia bacterium]|nr:MAG: hypothetical protein DVB23_000012 [Verrucomicrobiota bacterium]
MVNGDVWGALRAKKREPLDALEIYEINKYKRIIDFWGVPSGAGSICCLFNLKKD